MVTAKSLEGWVYVIVILIVLFQVAAALIPQAQTAGNTLNSSGVPLGSLFAGTGVVFYIIMGAILLMIVRSLMAKGQK